MKNINAKLLLFMCWIALVTACSSPGGPKSPEEWFQFTWSGLAGHDVLTFDGKASLLRGDQYALEHSVSYNGRLRDHHELEIVTTLPQSSNPAMTGLSEGHKIQAVQSNAQLKWSKGSWKVLSDNNEMITWAMPQLNPLDQLESINKIKNKKITAESGAARGTKVLRIELDPEEAKVMLRKRLTEEMLVVKENAEAKLVGVKHEHRDKLAATIHAQWSKGNNQLLEGLESANAKLVYHLTINRKTGLPQRLTSESQLFYPSSMGLQQHEIMITDNVFKSYK